MATIKDVAKEAGVSKTLVSRYLNGQPGVSEASKEKIAQAIEALHYRPNGLARSLVLRQTGAIGVVVDDLASPFIRPLINGLESAVEELECDETYTLIYANSSGDMERKGRQLRHFAQGRADGIILFGSMVADDTLIGQLIETGFPFTLIENDYPDPKTNRLVVDNMSGAQQATEYLLSLGHKNILHIGGNKRLKITKDRARGFVRTMEARGLKGWENVIFPEFPMNDNWHQSKGLGSQQVYYDIGYGQMEELICADRVPQAIFFATDLSAFGAIAALSKAGLSVPGDVSVVGFDDEVTAGALLGMHPITTVRQPLFRAGREAFAMLIDSINTGEAGRYALLETELVVRDSAKARE